MAAMNVNVVNGQISTNQATGLHGSDQRMTQGAEPILARAEFMDFAPGNCCNGCCFTDIVKARQYAFVGDNRLEVNYPIGTCGCCTYSDLCVVDNVRVFYFDKTPHRSAACCYCIPCTCWGPPIVFAEKPSCFPFCCIDLTCCYGETLETRPHNCCDWKLFCCCGPPCYSSCCYGAPTAGGGCVPLLSGLKNGTNFLAVYKMAYNNYKAKHQIPANQGAIFEFEGKNVGSAQQGVLVMNATVAPAQVRQA
eukprot:TRINITY_DN13369_c0_g1_i4.p1 TRINITY_DN13369_c0_g1~~TRINITY_DN13369_c0_g1_i4.p1  ORF type:complete len:250 (+),score=36.97 TRINITY_DN13369_c0_g1_i4:196-945(+)